MALYRGTRIFLFEIISEVRSKLICILINTSYTLALCCINHSFCGMAHPIDEFVWVEPYRQSHTAYHMVLRYEVK